MDGPGTAGTTETVYVMVEVETEVKVMVKLRVWSEERSAPKLKLACPFPSVDIVGLVSRVALTLDAAARSILPAPLFMGFERVPPLVELLTGR